MRSVARVVLSACVASISLGCTQEPREVPPPDCALEDAYEFFPIFLLDPPGDQAAADKELSNWYASGDLNTELPDTPSYATKNNFTGSICEHTLGKVFTFGLNHDWGSVGGRWQATSAQDRDASAYEGLSFWGLSLYDHSIELLLQDATSSELGGLCVPETDATTKATNPNFVDANGLPVADGCGSGFSRRLVMSKSWTLYTLPFEDFYQVTRDPRIKPGGIDPSAIWQFSFRVPKDTFVDVSFVNFAWYRKKPVN